MVKWSSGPAEQCEGWCTWSRKESNTCSEQPVLLLRCVFPGDPKLDIVQPAVEGTKTVLEAAAKQKAGGLQRVVVTSSVCGELLGLRPACPSPALSSAPLQSSSQQTCSAYLCALTGVRKVFLLRSSRSALPSPIRPRHSCSCSTPPDLCDHSLGSVN